MPLERKEDHTGCHPSINPDPEESDRYMSERISTDDAQYALDLVRAICTQAGPGLPGTPQERARAGIIEQELAAHLGAENVVTEDFTLAPGAFYNTYPAVACMLIAVALNLSIGRIPGIPPWVISAAALLFALFMPVSFTLEFLLSLEVFDPLFPKRQSVNVIGSLRKPGTRDIKRLIILSGHHDSAPQNNWLRYTGRGFFVLSGIFVLGMIALVVMCLIQLIGVILGNEEVIRLGTLGWLLMVFPIGPAIIYAAFLNGGMQDGGVVPGAADNLSACGVVVAMSRYLANNPSDIPDETEIRFITFGSEEAGLRGSRRYVKAHLDELKALDTRLMNYEIIAYPEIAILAADVNGTLKFFPEMVSGAVAAAQRAGIPYKIGAGGIGAGSDAAPFTRAGLKSVTLLAFKTPQQQLAFYHQDRDTPDVLSIEPLLNTLKLTLEWVKNKGI